MLIRLLKYKYTVCSSESSLHPDTSALVVEVANSEGFCEHGKAIRECTHSVTQRIESETRCAHVCLCCSSFLRVLKEPATIAHPEKWWY
jgi:hypothetical protein